MRLEIRRYSQDVDVHDPSKATYYLVVEDEKGKEHRIPSTKEAIGALVEITLSKAEGTAPPSTRPTTEEPKEPLLDESAYATPPDGLADPDEEEGEKYDPYVEATRKVSIGDDEDGVRSL